MVDRQEPLVGPADAPRMIGSVSGEPEECEQYSQGAPVLVSSCLGAVVYGLCGSSSRCPQFDPRRRHSTAALRREHHAVNDGGWAGITR